jgi:hypothetical protein
MLSEGLSKFTLAVGKLVQQSDSLRKLLEMECSVVDPVKDVQMFIAKNSTFADNDRLKNLYKQLGVYKPLGHTGKDGTGGKPLGPEIYHLIGPLGGQVFPLDGLAVEVDGGKPKEEGD